MKVRVLALDVYRSPFGDCTNGGISGKYAEVYVECRQGGMEVEEDDPRIMDVVHGFRGIPHLEPRNGFRRGNVGWMSGGNFAYSCDGRFGFDFPIAIHDRQETIERYRSLSN